MRTLFNQPNVDKSDLTNYPNGRIRNNDGSGNGTGVNEATKGDIHQFFEKLMRLYDIAPNDLPDNETNGFQLIEALKALASKNDYIYPLLTNGTTTLNIDIKLALMKDNEYLTCLASSDKTTETLIKGSGTSTFAVTYSGNFKANEYVRVVKTSGGVSIIRLADWNSLEAMAIDLGFLKKATQAQEDAGTLETVATTPKSNLTAFIKRVIGADSGSYLATAIRNGLYPKEHFAIVAGIGADPVKNRGWFSGLDVNGSLGNLPVNGDVVSAIATDGGSNNSIVTVNLDNPMDNTNYIVKHWIQGQSASLATDNDICSPVFKPISTSQFQIIFREVSSDVQNLKVHLEVVQL